MRKYRSWLMGLGIGLMIGASMLQLILAAQDQTKPLTREQLEKQAEAAGYVIYSAEESMYTEDELQAKIEEALLQAQEKANNAEPSSAPSDKQAAEPGAEASPESDASASASPGATEPDEPKATTLYVKYGMTLTEVAAKLEQLGVVDDGDDFLDKCWSIAKDLKVGTSVFTGKPTYRQIMTELTRLKP
ncbi:hypothetical protein [Cohnella panacarvi]|uniref:hypothetical protein n=1 Tax=Cohnella panacarvi TaxID=400776 RepID=UPI00047BC167|nr:hypothetical protein [Cohnella panacarvi]